MRISIMQPYFIPYAGYFRLFNTSDLFVIYDCVQFPRRGWVHRNRLTTLEGELSWLTLPIAKAPQNTLITDLKFTQDASERMDEQKRKFPLFRDIRFLSSDLSEILMKFSLSPILYNITLLKLICGLLHIPFNIIRSSALPIPVELKGQDRIIAIATHLQADTYINAPGGLNLYDKELFKQKGIELKFLPPYMGSYGSILPRLFNENQDTLKHEILSQT